MDSGRFSTPATVQQPVIERTSTGGTRTTWQTALETWCELAPLTGREAVMMAAQVTAVTTARITLPWSPTLDAMVETWRIVAGGRTWGLVSIARPGKRPDEVECMVQAGAKL